MPALSRRATLGLLSSVVAAPALSTRVLAQADYPNRPVTVIVPQAAGGANDIIGRIVAEKLAEVLGQRFVVENRAGAGGNLGSQAAARSAPDGYTLLVTISASQAINPALYARTGFDPVKDFAPVSMLGTVPNVLVVNPAFPARTVADLIRMAKDKPGEYQYASAGNGTLNHLVGEMLKSRAGIDLKHIPYRGIAPALSDVIAGHVPITFSNLPAVISQIQAGTVRALGVSTIRRNANIPDVPPIADTVPGFDAELWIALYAVAGTPQPIVDRLVAATHAALAKPDMKDKFAQQGADIVTSTPQELAAKLEGDLKVWAEIVRASGARIE
ncbi:Bug family tripartite tricarboxylate transporter substrate binding protein [Phreatobacter sp. AB_2022a]|uniref:Bug family tripartite tricarboxylate transporter substrate binding protein n=1 Tax=Phreatobacter sp. AB_2022a TaxID=3003134 RepID=UPI00228718FE|nr:tripartite tricarboxylate transporter substrate binding protein [Phreatobacter sp. AB_2022a]MCZ0734988.1 tripartite tricarboxylate transporter substrate binding protein [Phreatobacter sp. AB_2022a]